MILHLYESGDLDLENTNEDGLTPLFYSVKAGDDGMVRMFLDLGSKLEVLDPATSMTPLFDVVRRGYITIARMLLEAGSLTNVNDTKGLTPLWYACENGWHDMAKLLLEYEANRTIDVRDYRNYSPLSLVSQLNRLDIAKLLLDYGADPMILKEETPNYTGILSVISVCHKPGWLPETPITGKCQEWQPGFIITLEAILKSRGFYAMVRLIERYAGLPDSGYAIPYVGSGVDGSGTQGI
mmetsp:Transcript_52233/g.161801  ORF Transcript_52233/g.161801 Transcript_52233/m.161801 type:complete len:239 (-) Transcript_52233:82-798(-)